jgi:hypothetical protein
MTGVGELAGFRASVAILGDVPSPAFPPQAGRGERFDGGRGGVVEFPSLGGVPEGRGGWGLHPRGVAFRVSRQPPRPPAAATLQGRGILCPDASPVVIASEAKQSMWTFELLRRVDKAPYGLPRRATRAMTTLVELAGFGEVVGLRILLLWGEFIVQSPWFHCLHLLFKLCFPAILRRLCPFHRKPTPVGNLLLQGDNRARERRKRFRVLSPGHGHGLKHHHTRFSNPDRSFRVQFSEGKY